MGTSQPRTKSQPLLKCLPPAPKNEVQSFIGMINYLTKFLPRLTELAEPIRELVKEKVPFNWGPKHQEAFTLLKKELVRAPILAYYNPRRKLYCKQMPVLRA